MQKRRGNLCGSRNNPAVTDGAPLQRSAHCSVPCIGTELPFFFPLPKFALLGIGTNGYRQIAPADFGRSKVKHSAAQISRIVN
jgi:hypothetical protein